MWVIMVDRFLRVITTVNIIREKVVGVKRATSVIRILRVNRVIRVIRL